MNFLIERNYRFPFAVHGEICRGKIGGVSGRRDERKNVKWETPPPSYLISLPDRRLNSYTRGFSSLLLSFLSLLT